MDSNFSTSKVEKIENGIQHQGLPLKISERLVVAFSKLDGNNRFGSAIWFNGSFVVAVSLDGSTASSSIEAEARVILMALIETKARDFSKVHLFGLMLLK